MQRMIRRRRSQAITNYAKRIAGIKSGLPRVVVRKSNRGVMMQITTYTDKGDKVLAMANSGELRQFGWEPRSNMPTAYLTGMLLAKKAGMKDKECILDIGIYRPVKGSVVFAAAKGSKDNGMAIAANIEIDEKRLSGKHIAEYAKAGAGKVQFAAYSKANFDVQKLDEKFEAVKKQLMVK